MYQKVLIPLDGSRDAEDVIPRVQAEIAPDAEIILLHLMPLFAGKDERLKAETYLRELAERLEGDPERRRSVVLEALSIHLGIVNFAQRVGVDLIAMYTHDRTGLARIIKGSIAAVVQRQAPMQVKVFKPADLVGVG